MVSRQRLRAVSAKLYNEMIGVCPGNCLKSNQGGWQMHDAERQISFPAIGKMAGHRPLWFNKASIGHTIAYTDLSWPCDMGACPICGGTGKVQPLKDGDLLPQ